MGSAGELLCRRDLKKTETSYVPGQHAARIIDPYPQRDRADLAAILTYVDDQGRACDVLCLRYRDEGWRAIKVTRASLRKIDRSTIASVPPLEGELLRVVEHAAQTAAPFPFEEPSEDEIRMRRLAHKLWDAAASGTTGESAP